MNVWQLAPDALRELDPEERRVRRLEGIRWPTESEGRDGSWHPYFRVALPLVVGEPVEIVWPARGRGDSSLRSTVTAPTVALLDRRPVGPWNWAYAGETGAGGAVSLEGRPVAWSSDLEGAFLLAHLLNAAEEPLVMPGAGAGAGSGGAVTRPATGGAVAAPGSGAAVAVLRAGHDGQRTVLVAGIAVASLPGSGPAAERFVAGLRRWEGEHPVLAALAAVLRDLGAPEVVPVWELPEPGPVRQALLAGGLPPASLATLEAAGEEAVRTAARLAGRLAGALPWAEATRLLEAGGVAARVAAGDIEPAVGLTDRLLDEISRSPDPGGHRGSTRCA